MVEASGISKLKGIDVTVAEVLATES